MSANWTDKATKIREGEELPIDKLSDYLKTALPQFAGELTVEQFPSGFSNLTYLLRLGDNQLVLRRPPFGANIKSAHDMSREYRILSHLDGHYSKIPSPLHYCEDEDILGAPFYMMERVEGVILRSKPDSVVPEPLVMNGIARSLASTLAELHQVDFKKAGLENLGKPNGYVKRQIEGWTDRYSNARTDEIAEMDFAAQWLLDKMPEESGASLIHNDFKYDNVVLDENDWTTISAVLDWEMATLGDPLMDFGTSLGYWINISDPPFMKQMQLSPTTLPGNPSRSEFASWYEAASGKKLDNLVYYYVYGLFKIAVIIQQIYYRYTQGHTKDPRFASLIHGVQGCGTVAMQAIQKNRIDDLF